MGLPHALTNLASLFHQQLNMCTTICAPRTVSGVQKKHLFWKWRGWMWLGATAQNTADPADEQQEMEEPEQEAKAQQANNASWKTALHAITNPAGDCYGVCKFTLLSWRGSVCTSCSHAAKCRADILCMENLLKKTKKKRKHSQEDGFTWPKSPVGTNISSTTYRCQRKFSS